VSHRLRTPLLTVALLALAAVMFTATRAEAHGPRIIDTTVVEIGSLLNDTVIDSARGLAYVSAYSTNEVVSVDIATGEIQARRFFSRPMGLDLSSDGQYLYVALGSSTGIARVDLSDWSSTQIVLPKLGTAATYDVFEVSPGVVVVSTSSSSFGYLVRYNFDSGVEDRIADGRIYRSQPRFATDGGNNLYVIDQDWITRLDLSTPLFDYVDATSFRYDMWPLAIAPDAGALALASGLKLDPNTLEELGTFTRGPSVFSDDGALLYSLLADEGNTAPHLTLSDSKTTAELETLDPDCGDLGGYARIYEFTKEPGSSAMVATFATSLCIIHSDTVRMPLPSGGGRFFDDDASIHQNAIEAIATVGITKGCNPPYQTGYCPDEPVTRGQMAAFLVRALGLTATNGNAFIDDASVFEKDIDKLSASGITQGCNPPANTKFCPNDTVTRGQMAAFLVRAMGYPPNNNDMFVDDNGSIFETNINALAQAGVTVGCNPPANDRFCPDEPVTRAQMATFLARALNLPQVAVPSRPTTTAGSDLTLIQRVDLCAALAPGRLGVNGTVCEGGASFDGEIYALTGWTMEDWSSRSAAEKATFQSNQVRLEGAFDGLSIDLITIPFQVVDDIAYKNYSFQFPTWLQGDHVFDVVFIDEDADYVWTIRTNLMTFGDGYPFFVPYGPIP